MSVRPQVVTSRPAVHVGDHGHQLFHRMSPRWSPNERRTEEASWRYTPGSGACDVGHNRMPNPASRGHIVIRRIATVRTTMAVPLDPRPPLRRRGARRLLVGVAGDLPGGRGAVESAQPSGPTGGGLFLAAGNARLQTGPVSDKESPAICSAKGCQAAATWAVVWNNPRLHPPDPQDALGGMRSSVGEGVGFVLTPRRPAIRAAAPSPGPYAATRA
jgi:hypothetical protein